MTKKGKNIIRRLFRKYSLIILNEESNEEPFSFKLNRMNLLVIVALVTFFMTTLIILVVLYTPIHDYLKPPQSQENVADKQEILNLTEKVLELENSVEANDLYIRNLQLILSGEVPIPNLDTLNGELASSVDLSKIDLGPTEEDLALRMEVEQEEIFNIQGSSESQETGSLLFTPLKGIVTAEFSTEENHPAIDIAAQQGEAIKSVAAGTVIFTDWTPDTGYVAIIQHTNGMISVYKHTLTVYKKIGDIVKKGEVIAAVGNTGELTTGPHLHFELWVDGSPIDPRLFIVF